ncbi:hypothetical protein GCM10010971_26350 [Silvimonas amylolytica]|uniref:AbrB/MazE/SpoVT family DNA-binding domain-containing protein n=1 Tax=Silvimonas amylolytica TaxID=449663 RepID=A0ABQ2PN24_9NEIS|nr:hypothetical protein GCM10010971_26350 [Silvimonas amylolytica]
MPLLDCCDGSGDQILELSEELLIELGWPEGTLLLIESHPEGVLLRRTDQLHPTQAQDGVVPE